MITSPRLLAALGVVLIAAVGPSQPVQADLLPDLRMARLADLQIEMADGGERRLRFTAMIANVGAGPMEVVGIRRGGELDGVIQRIQQADDEPPREVVTDAQLFFAGDGHEHWHIRDVQGYRLVRDSDGGTVVSEKHGFCLWDNLPGDLVLPGTPQAPAFSCPDSLADGEVRMGLSVGWRDVYPALLPDQFIDVTGLESGRYRLWAEADPASADRPRGWFAESNEANNLTWVDLEIDFVSGSVRVLGYGPSA